MKLRHENKYVISQENMFLLRKRLSYFMEPDPHEKNGCYTVRSLYFDNYHDRALREKLNGVSQREKFRIRYYGSDLTNIFLEKKSKQGGMGYKETAPIQKAECMEILSGCWRGGERLKQEFYSRMSSQILRPKTIVVYDRTAFIYPGNIRVTLDANIRGSQDVSCFLEPDTPLPSLLCQGVLEIKWDDFFPDHLRDALSVNIGGSRQAFSKYAAMRWF